MITTVVTLSFIIHNLNGEEQILSCLECPRGQMLTEFLFCDHVGLYAFQNRFSELNCKGLPMSSEKSLKIDGIYKRCSNKIIALQLHVLQF